MNAICVGEATETYKSHIDAGARHSESVMGQRRVASPKAKLSYAPKPKGSPLHLDPESPLGSASSDVMRGAEL
jgi:hypothetical protein